ncbi:hypothetical protein [uncultured Roseobacter sp.]|uniref:hypothetical protein n=1 Tax=uncultured Roseobacter sp. TaxID=114847 RepID=UPI002604B959|nr:hypothetical protein [uncultured Roseobacter sp.]
MPFLVRFSDLEMGLGNSPLNAQTSFGGAFSPVTKSAIFARPLAIQIIVQSVHKADRRQELNPFKTRRNNAVHVPPIAPPKDIFRQVAVAKFRLRRLPVSRPRVEKTPQLC